MQMGRVVNPGMHPGCGEALKCQILFWHMSPFDARHLRYEAFEGDGNCNSWQIHSKCNTRNFVLSDGQKQSLASRSELCCIVCRIEKRIDKALEIGGDAQTFGLPINLWTRI